MSIQVDLYITKITKEELIEYLRDSFHDGHTHGISKAIDEYVAQQWPVLCEQQQTLVDEINRLNALLSQYEGG